MKQKCEENTLKYLKLHVKSKGKEIVYNALAMRKYLGSGSLLTIQKKNDAFTIRTRMTELKTNFKNKHKEYYCVSCQNKNTIIEETQEHVFIAYN